MHIMMQTHTKNCLTEPQKSSVLYRIAAAKADIVSRGHKRHTMTKDKIKSARFCAGLSQSQAAAKTGVNVRSIQDWEQGRSKPMTEFLLQSYLDALKK